MSSESEREKWRNEVAARQKNYVFPDTVRNETDGFRRIYESKKPSSPVLFVGILLLLLVVIVFVGSIFLARFQGMEPFHGPLWAKLLVAFGPYVVVLSGFGLLVYLLGRSAKKAIERAHTKPRQK
jgi:uncharacterized BrkB/YihY/UPF0761 family membrane protein